jgi:K+ transporter
MLSTPITEQVRQLEWDTICTIAKNNCFPLWIIHNLKNKIVKTQKTENTSAQTQTKPLITFTYHSPLIHKVTNLFKCTNLNIAFRTRNTIYSQLHDRTPQNKTSSIGIYRLQYETYNKSYVGQTGRTITIRHHEHTLYIKTNNPVSAYALHILNNRHEYGSSEHTI